MASGLTQEDFIKQLTDVIEKHLSNEKFGVSELAREMGMSRSNLLRKIQKATQLSASKFIRNVRLERAFNLLKENRLNVSEIAYEVGFSSSSYFVKCFHDHYGYPPGEMQRTGFSVEHKNETNTRKQKNIIPIIGAVILIVIAVIIGVLRHQDTKNTERSIAVLPFKNDSSDSTNIYFINGLMESLLNRLQYIEDIKVISRTSVEKYRNANLSIPEIANELNVNYIIEGSGQKIDDKILLNIQLIEGKTDKHLWSQQFNKQITDVFQLQFDIASRITSEIDVVLTPLEKQKIEKRPTENIIAYDYYLQADEFLKKQTLEGLFVAIDFLKKSISYDPEFAQAYGSIGIAYYYMDIFRAEKIYSDTIQKYADLAIKFDKDLSYSQMAKGFYYQNIGEPEKAVKHFEKALDYSPNSAFIINTLSEFYVSSIPNTQKYLEYALKGIQIDIASKSSTEASNLYLHVSNAFIQSGFFDEALLYIEKSLAYNPENIFAHYVKAYILYAKNKNLRKTKDQLLGVLQMDTNRIDVIQELGKIFYYMKDYENSYHYFKKLMDMQHELNLDIYPHLNLMISYVYSKTGHKQETDELLSRYEAFLENNTSIYEKINYTYYYAYLGEDQKALESFTSFAKQQDFYYWLILFIENEPMLDSIKNTKQFKETLETLKQNFWQQHNETKLRLKQLKLI